MYVSCDKNNVITAISERPFSIRNQKTQWFDFIDVDCVGKSLPRTKKRIEDLRVAVICNWGDECGIATYSKFLVTEIKKKVKEVHIFSENNAEPCVIPCWTRGESVQQLLREIRSYNPDFIIIQHEFGIFPKASYFLQLIQGLDQYPYVITL